MNSKNCFELAQKYIPGGVNSPVRAFHGVGGHPIFIKGGQGPFLNDIEGNQYIDYVGAFGPMIVGHAHPYVLAKINEALAQGTAFGAATTVETALAKKLIACMPSLEMVRFVNSGTEAAMSAVRLARAFTKRDKIIKFIGAYHGHADMLLVQAGSGPMTAGIPNSAGIPASITQHTLVARFNRLEDVADLFNQYKQEIAAVIVEPIAGNMNLVLPKADFLPGLRDLCDKNNSVLIFDEVMTGFRVGLHGAQGYYGVQPDLTLLGKVIGGGFPAAAFGGSVDMMRLLAPLGPVYQAGTLSGNPIAMTAGLATLELIAAPGFYTALDAKGKNLIEGLSVLAKKWDIPFYGKVLGGLFGFLFTKLKSIETEEDVKSCDLNLFKRFFHGMLKRGVYFAPSAFEAGFISSTHLDQEIQATLFAADAVFEALKRLNNNQG